MNCRGQKTLKDPKTENVQIEDTNVCSTRLWDGACWLNQHLLARFSEDILVHGHSLFPKCPIPVVPPQYAPGLRFHLSLSMPQWKDIHVLSFLEPKPKVLGNIQILETCTYRLSWLLQFYNARNIWHGSSGVPELLALASSRGAARTRSSVSAPRSSECRLGCHGQTLANLKNWICNDEIKKSSTIVRNQGKLIHFWTSWLLTSTSIIVQFLSVTKNNPASNLQLWYCWIQWHSSRSSRSCTSSRLYFNIGQKQSWKLDTGCNDPGREITNAPKWFHPLLST